MSTIENLRIQGIRSFGPGDKNEQTINFCKPLTLIVGSNGTGKTTIIECLKYATTGDYPPGCGSGHEFVHDPKFVMESSVKGQVKLGMKDVTGASCEASRSLVTQLKDREGEKRSTNYKDNIIKRKNGEGIDLKLDDMNREMVTCLGVSKAVLHNVIFCHQDDSNWPLGDGGSLKKKFDLIFDSARYPSAIEKLKEIQKDKNSVVGQGKKDLEELKACKEMAVELQRRKEDFESDLASSKARVEKINTDLPPIQARLDEISSKREDMNNLKAEIQNLTTEKKQLEKTIEDLKKNIKQPYEGTKDQLKQELNEFSSNIEKKRKHADSLKKQKDKVSNDLKSIAKDSEDLLLKVGKLENASKTQEENLSERDKKIRELAVKYNFEGFGECIEIGDEVYGKFLKLIKMKLLTVTTDLEKNKANMEKEEKKLQEKVDDLRKQETKIECDKKFREETMGRNLEKLKEINQPLSHMAISADLKQYKKDLSDAESSVNIDDLQSDIASLDDVKKQMETSLNKLNSEMNQLYNQAEAQTLVDMHKKNMEKKQTTIDCLLSQHKTSIKTLLGHIPEDDLHSSIESYIKNQSESERKTNNFLINLNIQLSSKETDKTRTLTQLQQKKDDVRKEQDKFMRDRDNENFEEQLEEVQRSLNQAKEEKGSLLGAEDMINKYVRNLRKNNPSCPLCHRGFGCPEEATMLISKLQKELNELPNNLTKAQLDIEKYNEKYTDLTELKSIKERIGNINQDISNLEAELKEIENEIKTMNRRREDCNKELRSQQSDLQMAQAMVIDVKQMDLYKGEVKQLKQEISQKAMLINSGSGRLLNKVISEQKQQQEELKLMNQQLEKKRKLQEKIKLEKENVNLKRQIEEARSNLDVLGKQIEEMCEEKRQLYTRKEDLVKNAKDEEESVRNDEKSVNNLNIEIKQYNESGKEAQLKTSREEVNQLNLDRAQKEEEEKQINKTLNNLQNEIMGQRIKERELLDSLQWYEKEEEIKILTGKINGLGQNLEGFDANVLEHERQSLMKEKEDLTQTKNKDTGRQEALQEQIKSVVSDIESDMYKNAVKKHSDKVIDNRTLEIANKDLGKYYKALDLAIMQYHTDKMEEINQIIQDLWRKTYKGNDIETIEIRSADETGISTDISARRSYNYKVMMKKNGIAINMRGRCSAGQRVLASFIIRLALAETFCVNCGILALDEPTTNLDKVNINKLASALNEIIKDRRSINFQLVVITHDKDFIHLLGRENGVDECFKVSKNDDGFSQINKKKIEDLYSC